MGWEEKEFAAVFYSEPGVLGFLANVLSAFLAAVGNMIDPAEQTVAGTVITGVHLIVIGGFVQLVAGLLSFRKYDHLAATAFVTFAALWSSMGVLRILEATSSTAAVISATLPGLVSYACVALVLSVTSATTNYIMPPVALTAAILLSFETVGLYYGWGKKVAFALEIVLVLIALYGATALLLKGVFQRWVIPGFGNAPFNVLLFGTRAGTSQNRSKEEEKKKNTKYAEPMGLGYLSNVPVAAIFAFHYLGFTVSFPAATPWVGLALVSLIIASYYSFLRNDAFHCIMFGSQATFWLCQAAGLAAHSLTGGNYDVRSPLLGTWAFLPTFVLLVLVSLTKDKVTLVNNLVFALLSVAWFSVIPLAGAKYAVGALCAALSVLSLYSSFANLINSVAEKPIMWVGSRLVAMTTLREGFKKVRCCRPARETSSAKDADDVCREGSSDTLAFLSNAVAAWAALSGNAVGIAAVHMAWIVGAGILVQLLSALLSLKVKKTAKPAGMVYIASALMWGVWTLVRFSGYIFQNNPLGDHQDSLLVGVIVLMVINLGSMVSSCFVSKIWLVTTVLMEVVQVCLLLFTLDKLPSHLAEAFLGLLGVVCLYGAGAALLAAVIGVDVLPGRGPIWQINIDTEDDPGTGQLTIPTPSSKKTSGLRTIADVLDAGGVCGIPTDTVYALAASCKHPEAIKRIYHVKSRPAEKPICVCISHLGQLEAAGPDFSPLLWDFMRRCYPGGISCVVPKGEWLANLGLGDAVSYIGTSDSICIRVPDSTATAHLVSMTGPLGITSANPSGEPDSTHHDMVLSSLGDKIDGMLCDGPSNELVASTVVNCMKIDEAGISFFRVGCTPQERVEQLFAQAKEAVEHAQFEASINSS
ncbi:YRDC [Branchiostoma lanceolatum]|uniref:Threonylcarbamoyl-AMP synthase n=1 Tax=Branchiostoma lanceolatum TaxID=7740 RepID=A0A8K0EW90_BRALA|nr:YRDC [Branchiostoma lanceolatum]